MGLWVLLGFIALSLIGQAVPLYTDWLWFQEVGFTSVFTTFQSASVCSDPSGFAARGKRSLVNITP